MGGGGGSKAAPIPKKMTQKEIDEAMEKLFGKGTNKSRAKAALPGILASIEQQRMAQLQNVPNLGLLPMMQNDQMGQMGQMGQMAMPQQSLLQSLATQGMNQISQGQTMNPTLFKAKV